ncbi:nucleoside phosphorylase domain-containing protein [Tricladium varicosporioides]|nr:nucleoside phosphorylase domain-containing protein [Hymenoscyphus varicosporioides]
MSERVQLHRSSYTVGWLCALPTSELVAARKMLDERHKPCQVPNDDENSYTFGSINGHNIVIACLPPGLPGKVSALRLTQPLARSFPNMKIHLFVGIGGGVPRNPPLPEPQKDIHLGDVVVGWPETKGVPAVVQYDLRKALEDGTGEQLGILDKPERRLLNALGTLLANHIEKETRFEEHLQKVDTFSHPGLENDKLFKSNYRHQGGTTCSSCEDIYLVERPRRHNTDLVFHQGTILSGDLVLKDAQLRDKLSEENYGAICFEMEAAGVMDEKHCLIIRGIADYSDSHKNDRWHDYAAATAASFAKEFLYTIQPQVIDTMKGVKRA